MSCSFRNCIDTSDDKINLINRTKRIQFLLKLPPFLKILVQCRFKVMSGDVAEQRVMPVFLVVVDRQSFGNRRCGSRQGDMGVKLLHSGIVCLPVMKDVTVFGYGETAFEIIVLADTLGQIAHQATPPVFRHERQQGFTVALCRDDRIA